MTTAGKKLSRNLTLPLVGIGVAAGKMSMDFNRSMGEISTQAGGSRKEVKRLGDQILKLTAKGRFAQGPQELTKALYDIESVGFRGAKAMKTLKAASDFATVGNADLESTTSALVGTLKTGIKGAGNMKEAIGTLNATIGAGKMHMEDLNAAIGTGFLGSAKGLGISLSGVGAALAELTSQGVPASSAATRLRMTMSLMANPTDKAKDALKGIGIGSEDLAKRMRSSGSLIPALEELQSHMKDLSKVQQGQLLASAFGGAKSGGTIIQLLGNLGDLSKKQSEVIENAGKINESIRETNAEPAVKMQKAWSKIQSTLITLGDVLVPAITPVIEELAGDISNIAKDFEKLSPSTQGWIVKIGFVVAALGPVLSIGGKLLKTFGASAQAAKAMAGWLSVTNTENMVGGGAGGVVGGAGRAGGAGGITAVEGAGAGAAGGGVSGALAKFGFKPGLGGFVVPVTLMVGSAIATHEFAQKVGKKTGTSGTGIPSWVEGIAANVAGTGSPIGAAFFGAQELTGGALPGPGHVTEKAGKLTWAVGVKPNLNPDAANKLKTQYRGLMHTLSSDSILGLKTINHHLSQGLQTASTIWGRNTPQWHQHTAQAMQAAVKSIRQGINAGTVNAKEGQHEINQILARIRLVKGSDPFGLAQATSKSFKEAGAITSKGVKEWEQKLALMPKGARESSQQSTLQMLRAWAQGHPKIEAQVNQLTSNLITKFGATNKQLREGVKRGATGPVAQAYQGLAGGVGGSLQNIGVNTQQVLKALGVKNIPQFQIVLATHGGSKFTPPGSAEVGTTHRAMGGPVGFTVPGSGEGDSFATTLPPGSFVLNKKATSAFGLQAGGHIPVMLEPRERVFLPPEVRGIGLRSLSAMNEAVPRFAKGGSLGGEPKLTGGTDILRGLGQAAIQRVYEGAKSYLAKHRGVPSGKGLMTVDGDPVAAWIAKILLIARKAGIDFRVSSGYRTDAEQTAIYDSGVRPAAVPKSEGGPGSRHEGIKYPMGAVDISPGAEALAAWLQHSRFAKTLIYAGAKDPVHFSHPTGGGYQGGGLIGRIAQLFGGGGSVGKPLFTQEGPAFYEAALKHNQPWATHQAPWQTHLNKHEEAAFRKWVANKRVPFDPNAERSDYDMRGFWKATGGAWSGGHFPDTWKTPFDTSFSNQSRYAKKGTPFVWRGNKLIDRRNGQIVFAEGFQHGGLIGRIARRLTKGGSVPGWIHSSSTLSADQLATLAHYVGAKSPGLMSQIAQAESGGNPRSMGGAGDKGLWQIIPSTASGFGIDYGRLFDPLANAEGMNKIAFTGGGGSPAQGLTAWSTYNSGAYRSEPKGHVLSSLTAAGSGSKPAMPKQISGVYTKNKAGQTSAGGGTYGSTEKAHYKVATAKLGSFGSLPSDLHACNKELRERQKQLGEYRTAYRQTKDPETRQAFEANIKLLEARVSALRAQKERLLRQAALKKALSKIADAANFSHWTAPNTGIFAQRENLFNELQEFAQQAVELEPEEPRNVTGDWVNNILKPYVEGTESPAYGRVLGAEEGWRNAIIGAQNFAEQKIGDWGAGITKLKERIEEIQALKLKNPRAYANQVGLIPGIRQKIKALWADITKTRTETLPEWEGTLGEVQGLGRTHGIVSLTGEPTGQFGGDIFDTQLTIKGLGLKVPQALENLSSPEPEKNTEREALLEELLRQSNQRNILRGIEERISLGMPKVGSGFRLGGLIKVMPPYAGKAHGGAIVPGPPTQEKTMVVKGREGIFTEEQMAAMGGDGGSIGDVKVHVHGDIVSSHPDPVEVLIGDRRFPAEVRKITDHDARREARGAGRGLARAGVFSR